MSPWLRLVLDVEDAEESFVLDATFPERPFRCEGCRTTFLDPQPGPVELDLAEPEGGCELLRPGVLWTEHVPAIIVTDGLAAALCARWPGSFESHPARIRSLDGEPLDGRPDGGPWVACWPTAGALEVGGGDAAPEPCGDCGRYPGEFEAAWPDRWPLRGGDAAVAGRVPGWRYTLFLRAECVSWLREQGAMCIAGAAQGAGS